MTSSFAQYIFIDILALISLVIGSIWSFIIISIIIYNRRQLYNISTLLICNSCCACIFQCYNIFALYVYMLRADLTKPDGGVNLPSDRLCTIRAWLLFSGACAVYWSYMLQGFHRLVTTVFYKKRWLQKSAVFYIIVIILQWIMGGLVSVLPLFLGRDF
ncbi:unnamed protein product [Didymodactylos carnosus]|uniref:G-protein coupled receptors family 1 profile domain-containing protein n=1 Tax=Didymodactylos carnosus TaxID=1234261 RepID=A0A814WSY7_9BILA|nr:unnamed protein product [Didymodactylos carnosus]CAF3970084.1 unnamed protein product [Didymodactylos carnosus]